MYVRFGRGFWISCGAPTYLATYPTVEYSRPLLCNGRRYNGSLLCLDEVPLSLPADLALAIPHGRTILDWTEASVEQNNLSVWRPYHNLTYDTCLQVD